MHNFKPGDLALIIAARLPDNIGKVVELISYHPASETLVTSEDGKLFNNDSGKPSWLVKGDLLAVNLLLGVHASPYGLTLSERLMPLRGDEQTAPAKCEELTW